MPSKKRIYIARHGERLDFVNATWERDAALPDDPPLTARGEQQAAELGAFLADRNITAVYASPFARCLRTAAVAASAIGTASPSSAPAPPLLRVEPGACEWLSASLFPRGPPAVAALAVAAVDATAPLADGMAEVRVDEAYVPVRGYDFMAAAYQETWEELMERCAEVVRAIVDGDEEEGNVLIVGHTTSYQALFKTLCPDESLHLYKVSCKFLAVARYDPFLVLFFVHAFELL